LCCVAITRLVRSWASSPAALVGCLPDVACRPPSPLAPVRPTPPLSPILPPHLIIACRSRHRATRATGTAPCCSFACPDVPAAAAALPAGAVAAAASAAVVVPAQGANTSVSGHSRQPPGAPAATAAATAPGARAQPSPEQEDAPKPGPWSRSLVPAASSRMQVGGAGDDACRNRRAGAPSSEKRVHARRSAVVEPRHPCGWARPAQQKAV
jgi:hypothetical protein